MSGRPRCYTWSMCFSFLLSYLRAGAIALPVSLLACHGSVTSIGSGGASSTTGSGAGAGTGAGGTSPGGGGAGGAPDPSCPVVQPEVGAVCAGPAEVCTYPVECCAAAYQCVGGHWLGVPVECPVAACPSVAPPHGSACLACMLPGGCTFTCPDGATTIAATCGADGTVAYTGECPPLPHVDCDTVTCAPGEVCVKLVMPFWGAHINGPCVPDPCAPGPLDCSCVTTACGNTQCLFTDTETISCGCVGCD